VCGFAEALPLVDGAFDIVHMRSMLDHASNPHLALAEAHRVLRPGGRAIIGLSVTGGVAGSSPLSPSVSGLLGSARLKYHLSGPKGLAKATMRRLRSGTLLHDHHLWRPTAPELRAMATSVGLTLESEQWQPPPFDHVIFIVARK
jgi:SAM-dependent methyltransferase